MGHEHHFLSRLDRVSLPHVELALELYRDHELMRFLLRDAELPEGAERAAISLADPKEGPFLVVTRARRPRGSRPPPGRPAVPRKVGVTPGCSCSTGGARPSLVILLPLRISSEAVRRNPNRNPEDPAKGEEAAAPGEGGEGGE